MDNGNFERSIEIGAEKAKMIPELVGNWWKEISKESKSSATPGKLYAVGNYLVALAKNVLGDGKNDGKVSAIFDSEKIEIVIEDLGGEEKEINLNVSGDYGMKEILEYADGFFVETRGKEYGKDKRNNLEEIDGSDIFAGARVTFIKYIGTPPIEEEEETYRGGRDFRQRM
jgi:hypothetical protein